MTVHNGAIAARGIPMSWEDVPVEFLKAELVRRQRDGERPACGSTRKGAYNTPLHVFALVLILVLSTAACSFPIIVRRFPGLHVPHHFLFLSRHFGTGVLIATAFVHLFPTAYVSLTDPCLPPFWNQGYPAMAGFIAMVSVLTVVGIEMFFAARGAGHVHGCDYDTFGGETGQAHGHGGENGAARRGGSVGGQAPSRPGHRKSTSFNRYRQGQFGGVGGRRPPNITFNDYTPGSTDNLVEGLSPSPSNFPPSPIPNNAKDSRARNRDGDDDDDAENSDSDLELPELDTDSSNLLNGAPNRKYPHVNADAGSKPDSSNPYDDASLDPHALRNLTPSPGTVLTPAQKQKKQLLQCLLLEAGILFHSVFIGMALSVSTGPPFLILLIAISFHQTFEGLALGSRIAALAFGPRSPKPWLMALAYGTTTPLGQAIGLGIHNLYDPASQTGLLTVGVMNAVSSGLLLFAGLVELLAEDFLSDVSYVTLRGRRRVEACASVAGGAALMALVGVWA